MSLVENRESGEKYLKEHNIDDALRLMRENLIKVQPENPWSFMIDMLTKCKTNEKLEEQRLKNTTPKKMWSKAMTRLRSRSRLHALKDFITPSGKISFIHFNDVYNIQERAKREPCGGAARFTTLCSKLKSEHNALVMFSGDCLAPSIMSTVTKGSQMPVVLNKIGVDVAVYGNHDFDFGISNLEKRARECNFPWLISNVLDRKTRKPLANGISEKIISHQGNRIGFIGLVENEWLATLATIDENEVLYEDFVKCARRLAESLRRQGVHYVVALTHMRKPNDERLAREAPEVDLILGGHDHNYVLDVVNGRQIVKSGTDFRDLTVINIDFDYAEEEEEKKNVFTTESGAVYTLRTERHSVTRKIVPDKDVEVIVKRYGKVLGAKMEKIIGSCDVRLDSRFSQIRTRETNLGNFIADTIRHSVNCDVVLLNSGTLRADEITPVGELKARWLVKVLPMVDEMCVLEIDGKTLKEALECGVSMWPRLEGRFPQISGMRFEFDGTKPPGNRVTKVTVAGNGLDLSRTYRLCTKEYIAGGKDGYVMLPRCKVVLDGETCPVLPTMVRNYFRALSTHNGFVLPHHQEISHMKRVVKSSPHIVKRYSSSGSESAATTITTTESKHTTVAKYAISPKVDGRIREVSGGGD